MSAQGGVGHDSFHVVLAAGGGGRIDIGVVQLALVEAGHADAGGNDDARGAGRGKPGAAAAAGAGIASLETARARSRRKSAPRTIEPDDASNDGSADLDYRELPADADADARHRRAQHSGSIR